MLRCTNEQLTKYERSQKLPSLDSPANIASLSLTHTPLSRILSFTLPHQFFSVHSPYAFCLSREIQHSGKKYFKAF